MIKQRDGRLSALPGQKLYWLVKNESAFSVRSNGMIEIFRAKPNPDCVCGYRFIFVFTFKEWHKVFNGLAVVGSYGGIKRFNFCNNARIALEMQTPEKLMRRKPIDLSYTPEAQEAARTGWEAMQSDTTPTSSPKSGITSERNGQSKSKRIAGERAS